MTWARLFSPCWLGHEPPIKVLKGRTLLLVCPRCQVVLRKPLAHQRLRLRKPGHVVAFRAQQTITRKVGR